MRRFAAVSTLTISQSLIAKLDARVAACAANEGTKPKSSAALLLKAASRRIATTASTAVTATTVTASNGGAAATSPAIADESNDTAAAAKSALILGARASRWVQLRVLLYREWVCSMRNPRVLKARLFIALFLALLIGGIYFQTPRTQSGAQDRIFLILITGAAMGVRPMIEIARLFLEEKALVNLGTIRHHHHTAVILSPTNLTFFHSSHPPPHLVLCVCVHLCASRGRLRYVYPTSLFYSEDGRRHPTTSDHANLLHLCHVYARAHSCSSHNTNSPNPSPFRHLTMLTIQTAPTLSLPPSLTTHLPTPSQRYPMVGLNPDGVLTFILALFVTCLAAQSVGLCMGASLNDERLIAVVAPVRAALHTPRTISSHTQHHTHTTHNAPLHTPSLNA